MKFKKISLDLLLSELADLPSEWLDDEGRRLVSEVPVVIERIRAIGPMIDEAALATLLHQHPRSIARATLNVCLTCTSTARSK